MLRRPLLRQGLRLKSVEVEARYEAACEVEVRLQSAGKQQPGSRPRIPPSPSSPSSPSFAFEKYMTEKGKSSQTHPLYIYPQAAPPPLPLTLLPCNFENKQKVKRK